MATSRCVQESASTRDSGVEVDVGELPGLTLTHSGSEGGYIACTVPWTNKGEWSDGINRNYGNNDEDA